MMSEHRPSILDRLNTALLRALPQHLLARGMYHLTRSEWPPLKNALIRFFAHRYRVNVAEAANPDLYSYPSFNAFFTRALHPDVRRVASEADALACPADGRVSQAGDITGGRLLQAQGHDFALRELLAGDATLSAAFADGMFATVYLSPRDYHRVHMPLTGRLRRMDFVPGTLFSVSEATAQLVPGLFARNERVVCIFDTVAGPLAVILVGAIFVGSIETVWAGEVRPPGKLPTRHDYPPLAAPVLDKGAEMGRFNMGSTVIVLLPKATATWDGLRPGQIVRLGERIATLHG